MSPLVYHNGKYWKLGDNLPSSRQEILDGINRFANKYYRNSVKPNTVTASNTIPPGLLAENTISAPKTRVDRYAKIEYSTISQHEILGWGLLGIEREEE